MALSTPEFARPQHWAVTQVLSALNAQFLAQARCYFGGGTQLALKYGEYRESRDVDFLCADRDGYRLLREQTSDMSLGDILRRKLPLAREVRADRSGIRTFFGVDELRIRFEIVLEGRIDLEGIAGGVLPVQVLTARHAIAEAMLANADRGLDVATHSRDLIDLAFVAASDDASALHDGLVIAEAAYGTAVRRHLLLTLQQFSEDKTHAKRCVDALAITDIAALRKGMRVLKRLIK